uniref:Uncharacterized protein n=1 Tax=Oryza sativa subsp. japonica TaxID=39947 RepID=Q6K5E2_ORYSJ|nr:hypothetical protein [Oryza sativa Japonica Group]
MGWRRGRWRGSQTELELSRLGCEEGRARRGGKRGADELVFLLCGTSLLLTMSKKMGVNFKVEKACERRSIAEADHGGGGEASLW